MSTALSFLIPYHHAESQTRIADAMPLAGVRSLFLVFNRREESQTRRANAQPLAGDQVHVSTIGLIQINRGNS